MTVDDRTMNQERMVLEFGPLQIGIRMPTEIVGSIRRETEPFFTVRDSRPTDRPVLEIALHRRVHDQSWLDAQHGSRVAVDTSLYQHLASDGWRFDVPGGYVVRIELTKTCAYFDGSQRRVDLYQPVLDLLILDAVRTVKSLLTPAVEAAGGVQLHAAAVTLDDGRAVLLLGDMWQGKTTLLLELLAEFHVHQLTCDTLVLLPDRDGLSAHGWPSPFSVSHGSLSDHPELAEYFPVERRDVQYDMLWREGKKVVLSSGDVVDHFGTTINPNANGLAHCLVVRFKPDEPTGLRTLTEEAEVAGALRSVYLGTRDPIYHDWHGYIRVSDTDIDRNVESVARRLMEACPVSVMTWAPSATSLLKRVPPLGRTHKHLGNLLTNF
jgi:hypothetical protein